MTQSTMIHYVTGVTDWEYTDWNNNSVSFRIAAEGGGDNRITLFGMKPEVAKDFYERNTSGNSSTIQDKKRIDDLEKALDLIAYGNIRVTDIGGIAKDALEADPEYCYMPF